MAPYTARPRPRCQGRHTAALPAHDVGERLSTAQSSTLTTRSQTPAARVLDGRHPAPPPSPPPRQGNTPPRGLPSSNPSSHRLSSHHLSSYHLSSHRLSSHRPLRRLSSRKGRPPRSLHRGRLPGKSASAAASLALSGRPSSPPARPDRQPPYPRPAAGLLPRQDITGAASTAGHHWGCSHGRTSLGLLPRQEITGAASTAEDH
jgi:hypothetical protein